MLSMSFKRGGIFFLYEFILLRKRFIIVYHILKSFFSIFSILFSFLAESMKAFRAGAYPLFL